MTSPLRQAWLDHLENAPHARTLDVAMALGVSEAELLASRPDATRLRDDWSAFLDGLPSLGRVMCLTRNPYVVHELTGAYETIHQHGPIAGAYGGIDQRLIVRRWGSAFAAPVENRRGTLQSIQVFDTSGTATLKIYARDETDVDTWNAFVDSLAWDAAPEVTVAPIAASAEAEEPDVDTLRTRWAALRDTHEVHGLLRQLGLGRLQATRLLGDEWATEVAPAAVEALLEAASATGEKIMVFVSNAGNVQIYSGAIQRVMRRGSWLNILDPGFNLHLNEEGLDSVWIVRKPTTRGPVWSFEGFAANGLPLFQFFGKRVETGSQADSWIEMVRGIQELHRR